MDAVGSGEVVSQLCAVLTTLDPVEKSFKGVISLPVRSWKISIMKLDETVCFYVENNLLKVSLDNSKSEPF